MADGKIYITISDTRGSGGSGGGSGGSIHIDSETTTKINITEEKASSKTLGSYATHSFYNFIESEARTMVNYSLGNIGNFTGNYQQQREINNALSGISMVKNIATSAISGAMVGGAVGAVVGAGIAIATAGINYALSENTASKQNKYQNNEIALLREKSGLNGLTNGSR